MVEASILSNTFARASSRARSTLRPMRWGLGGNDRLTTAALLQTVVSALSGESLCRALRLGKVNRSPRVQALPSASSRDLNVCHSRTLSCHGSRQDVQLAKLSRRVPDGPTAKTRLCLDRKFRGTVENGDKLIKISRLQCEKTAIQNFVFGGLTKDLHRKPRDRSSNNLSGLFDETFHIWRNADLDDLGFKECGRPLCCSCRGRAMRASIRDMGLVHNTRTCPIRSG